MKTLMYVLGAVASFSFLFMLGWHIGRSFLLDKLLKDKKITVNTYLECRNNE